MTGTVISLPSIKGSTIASWSSAWISAIERASSVRSCASRTPHEAELLFGLITQRRAGGQREASTDAPRRNKAQGAVGTLRAAASSLVRCLSSDRPRTIGEAPRYGKRCWLDRKSTRLNSSHYCDARLP